MHVVVICGGDDMAKPADEVIAEMGRANLMEKIEACMSGKEIDEVNNLWSKRGNISWFEAFSIWLLRNRGIQSLCEPK